MQKKYIRGYEKCTANVAHSHLLHYTTQLHDVLRKLLQKLLEMKYLIVSTLFLSFARLMREKKKGVDYFRLTGFGT